MKHLEIRIDLTRFLAGDPPNEVPVLLHELAEWMEKRPEPYAPTFHRKLLLNCEGQPCGHLEIYEA